MKRPFGWFVVVSMAVASHLLAEDTGPGLSNAASGRATSAAAAAPPRASKGPSNEPAGPPTTPAATARERSPVEPNDAISDTYIVSLGNSTKGYIAAAGGVGAPPIAGASTGDVLLRSENVRMIFSANAGASSHLWITNEGRLGIRTPVPASGVSPTLTLDVGGWPGIPSGINNATASISGDLFLGNTVSAGARLRHSSNALQGFMQWNLYYNGAGHKLMDINHPGYEVSMSHATGAGHDGIYFSRFVENSAGAAVGTQLMSVTSTGVGIGVAAPAHKLHVGGHSHFAGNAHFEGTVTGTNIKAAFQDLAEWVPATEDLPPGTVVVVKKDATNTVAASSVAYDTTVAGVVSAQPGITLGVEGPGMVQVATTGRVKLRVDSTKGAIAVGDLLVTSDIVGTAMRSVPTLINGTPFHRPGTLIGKALEPLRSGVAEILVLLSLQ